MIRRLVIAALLTTPLHAEEKTQDHLRFINGDQLEGRFGGINSSGKIFWERPDISAPIELQRDKVRQIVLRDARPVSPLTDPCHVTLINGDRIPGKVVAADSHEMTLESSAAGTLTLARDTISAIAPNPFGGRLLYAGPFDDKGWHIVPTDKGGDDLLTGDGPAPRGKDKDKKKDDAEDADKPAWSHAGAAWYSRGGGDALTYDAGMPDRSLLRFKLGWRSRPTVAVAFHADFTQPVPKKKGEGEAGAKEEDRPPLGVMPNFARLFGSSYVLNFNSGYVHLQRTGFDEDERVRVGATTVRLPDTGDALFEIRCDRKEGSIAVYINGEFAVQWYTAEEGEAPDAAGGSYKAPGGGFGFHVQGGATQIRISDIVVAEWNGMTDSARSMETDEQDIVLLNNGTDRFSGSIRAIHENQVEIEAKYASLKIPMQDVAEIHFARSNRRKVEEDPESGIVVHMQPVGRISGVPVSSADGRMQLESQLAGKIDLDLAPAVVLEFQSAGGFLDEWEDDL